MKSIYLLLFASFSLFFLSQCRKGGGTMRGYFWTSHLGGGPYHLYFNDTLKGVLPYQPQAPQCGDTGLENKSLYLLLSSGTHTITIKDSQGKIVLHEKYIFEKSSGHFKLGVSIITPGGRNQHMISGDCSIEELGF